MENSPPRKPHVVIVGAGFGGLEAAKLLINEPVRMTVIDRTNHHLFQPLLYQIATAALSPADIAAPIRGILGRCKNTELILGEVKSVNVEARTVNTGDREIPYDYLILATGARHSYFGHDEWEKLASGLKSLEDALEQLKELGVEVHTGVHATNLTEAGLQVGRIYSVPRQSLGGREHRVVCWQDNRRTGRSRRPRDRERRPYDSRPSRSPGHRRPGKLQSRWWQTVAWRVAGGDAAGPARCPQYSGDDERGKAATLSLLGQRQHGHDRTEPRGCGSALVSLQRFAGVARVALRPYYFSGRLSKSPRRPDSMGVGLRHLQ